MDGSRIDELPKVTAAHLRRAESLCALRLAYEHRDQRGNWRNPARFRVANQLLEDTRLLHADCRAPRPEHFRPGPELVPEERRVYETAARWYVALFADIPARVVDVHAFETVLDPPGVRLVGSAGLPLQPVDGRRVVRLLRLSAPAPPHDLLDDVTVRFVLLRLAEWAGGSPVRVQVVDLVLGRLDEVVVDTGSTMRELRAWLSERVAVIRERVTTPRPAPGLDCASCGFVARCGAHQ